MVSAFRATNVNNHLWILIRNREFMKIHSCFDVIKAMVYSFIKVLIIFHKTQIEIFCFVIKYLKAIYKTDFENLSHLLSESARLCAESYYNHAIKATSSGIQWASFPSFPPFPIPFQVTTLRPNVHCNFKLCQVTCNCKQDVMRCLVVCGRTTQLLNAFLQLQLSLFQSTYLASVSGCHHQPEIHCS